MGTQGGVNAVNAVSAVSAVNAVPQNILDLVLECRQDLHLAEA